MHLFTYILTGLNFAIILNGIMLSIPLVLEIYSIIHTLKNDFTSVFRRPIQGMKTNNQNGTIKASIGIIKV